MDHDDHRFGPVGSVEVAMMAQYYRRVFPVVRFLGVLVMCRTADGEGVLGQADEELSMVIY